jgi:hypothetical protein
MRTATSAARMTLTGAARSRAAATGAAADGPLKACTTVDVVPDEAAFTAAGSAFVRLI